MTNAEITVKAAPESLIGRYIVETTDEDTLTYKIVSIARGWVKLQTEEGVTRNVRPVELDTSDDLELMDADWMPDADEARLGADEDESEEGASKMANQLKKYRDRYTLAIAPSGRKSLNNGDPVATAMEGMDLELLYANAEALFGLDLRSKYAHLNKGAQRMNIGNRIRAAHNKADHPQHAAIINWVKGKFEAQQ